MDRLNAESVHSASKMESVHSAHLKHTQNPPKVSHLPVSKSHCPAHLGGSAPGVREICMVRWFRHGLKIARGGVCAFFEGAALLDGTPMPPV